MNKLSVNNLLSLGFWQKLNPHLNLSDTPSYGSSIEFMDEQIDRMSDRLHHDGYIHEGPVFDPEELQNIRLGIEKLVQAGLPPAFIYVYDDVWALFDRLNGFLTYFLGEDFGLLPHFWAWHIDQDDQGATSGWPPHVDYPGECAFFDDYLISMSLWVPLTDATPENGCMNVLPVSRQKTYENKIKDPEEILLQDVRCLPAKAGSLLGWRQDVWHWSGRSSRYAENPRISLSLEFQNRAFDPLCPPLFDLKSPPAPLNRVKMIFGQFSKYDHMERVTPELDALARDIKAAQP